MLKLEKKDAFWFVVMVMFIGSIIGYKVGYNEAVKHAELVSSNDTSYTISYEGQLHEYEYYSNSGHKKPLFFVARQIMNAVNFFCCI